MCLGCHQKRPKRELVRLVRSPDGVIFFDPSGKAKGRGAYLCPCPDCLKSCEGQAPGAALRSAIPKELLAELEASFSEEMTICSRGTVGFTRRVGALALAVRL